ncbi:hypothetical protein O181_008589 [Austropuccinia psidii MF-1]|uniref:Uncharacterized protein n=1 Tax=Austropuccinia psidii MF-1 TaxID=1389203 RepID=A0A9Q3BP55_9BASI|nr:hypothetical protein [Austropuccinia psidii MF-1]
MSPNLGGTYETIKAKISPKNKWKWNLGWNEEGWTDVNYKKEEIEEEVNYRGKPMVGEGEDLFKICIPYLQFEELLNFSEKIQSVEESQNWGEILIFFLSSLVLLELLTYEGIKGNLGNIYWEEDTLTDVELRRKLFLGIWKLQKEFCLTSWKYQKEEFCGSMEII